MFAATLSALSALLFVNIVTADVRTVFNINEEYKSEVQSINIHESLMTVITCEKQSDPKPILNCNISHTQSDDETKTTVCPIIFENMYGVSGYPLTADKAILISQDDVNESMIIISILNLSNCTYTKFEIHLDTLGASKASFLENRNAIMINSDGTFNILFNDPRYCDFKVCRLTFDTQGKPVGDVEATFKPLVNSFRNVKKLQWNSSFIVTELLNSGENYKMSLIKPDAQIVLKENKTYRDVRDHDVSVSHGLIRLCSKIDTTKVDCQLIDYASGKAVSEVSIAAPHRVEAVTIENLANGEFLLLNENEHGSVLMKVKTDGSIIGVTKLPNFNCTKIGKSYIFVSNGQYCVTRQCMPDGHLRIVKECSGDRDFH